MHRLAKGVLSPVLPEDPGMTLTSAPKVTVTKGQRKTNSTKRDKSYWEHWFWFRSSDLDLVRVPLGEADRHRLLGVRVEGVVVDEIVYLYHMDAHCPLYTCNANIIVVIESVVGKSLNWTGLQIGTRDMLEHIHQEIPFI
ncbi:hypothetical protein M9H77_01924 [Catharanthus roseus]|uniref:Uncharacterized protein n=1 Tax=Catharanthus roseus TaxID=4058 RepID=A0ACC0C776_CATRO|nr:hypothetical protein M9H77_01924 [Catharanthus roseus]